MAYLDRLAQVVGADRVEEQDVVRTDLFAHGAEDGHVGFAAFVGVELVCSYAAFASRFDLLQIPFDGHVSAGEVDWKAVAHSADQVVHGHTGGLAGDVPQAVVEVAEPSGRLVDPAGALVQPLVERFAVEGILADGVVAQDFDLAE